MATAQSSATIGVFNTRSEADRAVDELLRSGYSRDQIGVVARGEDGKAVARSVDDDDAGDGTAAGLAAGAGVAGLVSLGISFGVIPVVGPILAVGPWTAALISAAGGALAGGIVGALTDWGVPEDEARYYEGEVKSGKYLVTIKDGDDKAWGLMKRGGAYNYGSRRS